MGKSLSKSRFIEMFGNVATNNKRWEKTKLGNKSVIGSSKRIFANEYTTEGIPFYRSKEIIELGMGEKPSVELYISKKRYQEIKEKFGIPIPGDILMTAVGTIGKFWIVPNSKPFYYKDGNLVYIRTKEFNPLFLKKLLEMLIEKYKVENANGSAYTALTIEKLKDLQIVLPPMTLQKQYEEFYIQIDKLKFILQKMIEKLELLKKSRFIELFGDEKEDHHLIDLCLSITDGSHNPPKGCDTSNNLMISSQNVINNTINLDKVRFISDEDYVKENKRTNIQEGDVLLTIVGTIGRTAVVPKLNVNLVAQRSICILHPNKDVVEPNFLSYMLDNVSNKIEYESRGIAQKGIYLKQVKEFNVIFPKIEQQREFTEFIHQIDKSKLILQKQLDDLVGETK